MFFSLSKLLPLLVYPVGMACLLLGAALLAWRKPRLQRTLVAAALAVIVLFGNQWVAEAMASRLEWRYLPADDYPRSEAIVLLGGGTRPKLPPRPLSEMNEAGDRMVYAAQLYHAGKAPRVIVSGGAIELYGATVPEAEPMRELLRALGVPDEAIVSEERARNTYENAIYVREILEEYEIDGVLLVTSALHMPRSVAIFAKQGIAVTPAPTDFMVTWGEPGRTVARGWDGALLKLMPSAEYLDLSTRVLREYLGLVVYRLRGWL